MRTLRSLKAEATRAVHWRGHTMTRWEPSDYWPNAANATCKRCGASVAVQVNPPPNSCDIVGDAVALNCPRD